MFEFIKKSLLSGSQQSSTRIVFYGVASSGIAFVLALMVAMIIDVAKDGRMDMSLIEVAAVFPAVGAYIWMGAQPKNQSDIAYQNNNKDNVAE
ncbi:MAG: hypothetical protein IKO36_09400 [Bacteroidaceae bacterium]|nr:hypothetical protein [Bacteroidaceae bacterium]